MAQGIGGKHEVTESHKASSAMEALADADGDGVISAEEAEALAPKASYGPKYMRALSGPLLVFLIGVAIGMGLLDLSTIDAMCATSICPWTGAVRINPRALLTLLAPALPPGQTFSRHTSSDTSL